MVADSMPVALAIVAWNLLGLPSVGCVALPLRDYTAATVPGNDVGGEATTIGLGVK